MAVYPPPSENPPTFNALDFVQNITQTYLDENFLRLKAQRDENMNGFGITNMKAGDPAILTLSNAASMDDVAAGGGGVFLPLAGGTMAGAIDMGSNQINNLADGAVATDAVAFQQLNNYLPLAGGTMTGDLIEDDTFPLGGMTATITSTGIGTSVLTIDGQGVSNGTCNILFSVTSATAVTTMVTNNLRANGVYRMRIRNTSGFTITFNSSISATNRTGFPAAFNVPNASEAEFKVAAWTSDPAARTTLTGINLY